MNITYPKVELDLSFGPGEFSRAEREGVVWLAQRRNWSKAHVTRQSAREYDLRIEGQETYETDELGPSTRLDDGTGYEHWRMGKPTGKRVLRHNNFVAWFPLACIREFWAMDLIANAADDWSFLRDRDEDVQWADFHAVLAGRTPTGQLAPVGAIVKVR